MEEYPLPYTSPSAVTFCSQIEDNELKSKSLCDANWSIQREISITIEYILPFLLFKIISIYSSSVKV